MAKNEQQTVLKEKYFRIALELQRIAEEQEDIDERRRARERRGGEQGWLRDVLDETPLIMRRFKLLNPELAAFLERSKPNFGSCQRDP